MADDKINITLALAKQSYDELAKLASIDDIEKYEFGSGKKRDHIEGLLKGFSNYYDSIKIFLSKHVSDTEGAPILSLSQDHRSFYNEIVIPHGDLLQRAYYEIANIGFLIDFWDEATDRNRKPNHFRRNAISWALERWSDTMDEDDEVSWYDRGFNILGASELVGMPWFQPDEWSRNLKYLQPVLVDRQSNVMQIHVRQRLTEIYRAFTFGLWMSAVALSRSLIEYSLKQNAARFNISSTYQGGDGGKEDKSLARLGNDVAEVLPALKESIEKIREAGNRILHPRKHDVIALPMVMRSEALDCIIATKLIVETLYSEVPSPFRSDVR